MLGLIVHGHNKLGNTNQGKGRVVVAVEGNTVARVFLGRRAREEVVMDRVVVIEGAVVRGGRLGRQDGRRTDRVDDLVGAERRRGRGGRRGAGLVGENVRQNVVVESYKTFG